MGPPAFNAVHGGLALVPARPNIVPGDENSDTIVSGAVLILIPEMSLHLGKSPSPDWPEYALEAHALE